jgi:hypothetical protein
MDADVNTLLHIHNIRKQFDSKRNGLTIGLITASSVNSVYFLLFHTRLFVECGERLCSETGEHRKWVFTNPSAIRTPSFCNLISVV